MSVQRFDDAPFLAASSSLFSSPLQMSSYASTLPRPQGLSAGGPQAEAERPADAIVNLRDLGRGVGWALVIEGAAALSLYGLWRLWRLWL